MTNNTTPIKEYLQEMFPELDKSKIELLSHTGDDLSVIVTRILDNNIDSPTVNIKDFQLRSSTVQRYHGNHREMFNKAHTVDPHLNVDKCRLQASALNEEAAEFGKKAMSHEIKETRHYFSIEAEKRREKAQELNDQAFYALIKKNLDRNDGRRMLEIDLHGFTVKEAEEFIENLYLFKKFEKIRIITGQKHRNSKIRPKMEEWLERKGFSWQDEGTSIYAWHRR